MGNLTYETSTEQQPVGQTAVPPTQQSTPSRLSGLGRGVARDTAVLQRMTNGRLSRAGNSLLQLQRSHGNRHVQRVITQAKPTTASNKIAQTSNQIHQAAAAGVRGSGAPLPHINTIQASFGHHDLSDVQAYQGPSVAVAAHAIGADAYTTGNKIAFAATNPDLYLAAHEAAHVIQQRSGLRLQNGLGQTGDPYERHADAVAARVAQGQEAASLLDQLTAKPSAAAIVQTSHPPQVQGNLGFELEVSIPVSEYDPVNGDNKPPNARDPWDDWENSSVQLPITNNPQTPIWNNLNDPVYGVADSSSKWNKLSEQAVPAQLLELVVHHFPTDNLGNAQQRLTNQVRPQLDNIYNLINAGNPAQYRFRLPNTTTMVGLPHGNDPRDVVDGGHNARAAVSWGTYMQATAGIKLSAIQSTLRKVADVPNAWETLIGKDKDRRIAQKARTAATNTYNAVAGGHAFAGTAEEVNDIKGFLSLIGLYVRGGAAGMAVQTNANPKNMAPIFLRSAFDQISLNSLTNNARDWLANNHLELGQNLVRQLRPTAARTAAGEFPYQQQFDLDLFDKIINNPVPESVGTFVLDALQSNPDTYTRRESKSLVAPENVGAARPAPVMEFRKINAPGDNPAQWVAKMGAVLQDVHNLNL